MPLVTVMLHRADEDASVEVPHFVAESVNLLRNHLHQEGLFRKAGSNARQKELMARVDNGGTLCDKYTSIDVANCLKSFFRQLPEPLVPYPYHDLFVRCAMLKTAREDALLLACMLLPPRHIDTLAYLMEFLRLVAANERFNKMSVENLAKIFVPSIMPLQETTILAMQTRLEAHMEIVKVVLGLGFFLFI